MDTIFSNSQKPSIPSPCHEDWNEMTPQEKGRHCQVCDKVVIDFSNRTDEEIQQEIVVQQQLGNRVCGHFKAEQIQKPITIYINKPVNKWRQKWMAFWSLIGFTAISTTSCAQSNDPKEIRGKVATKPPVENQVKGNIKPTTLGEIPIQKDTSSCTKEDPILVDGEIEPMVSGDIAAPPPIDASYKVDQEAQYPNGQAAIGRYIADRIVLNKKEIGLLPKDSITVKLIIDRNGNVSHVDVQLENNVTVRDKISALLYEMPQWSPATKEGNPVSSYITFPIKLESK